MSEANLQQKLHKASTDCVYFIKEFGVTFDPRTKKKDLVFNLYPFQEDYVRDLVKSIKNKEDIFVEKSRDMGVSWVTLYVLLWFWIFSPKFQCLIGSRKEDYVDNRTIDSLFGKFDYALKHLPFRPEGFIAEKHRLYMKLTSPVTGSVIRGESANANFSRSGRYDCIFFDELAFWPFQQYSWEAAGDATPCRIAVTTPSPEVSYAKALRESGKIKVSTLHWRLHPLKTGEWYANEKLRRTDEEVARELDINWEGSLEGIVWPEHQYCRFGDHPYQSGLPIYVSWDFGLDGTAIGWWQIPPNGRPKRIESFYKVNKPIQYFLPLFGSPIESDLGYSQDDLDVIEKVKDWQRPIHYGDPDVEKRAYQSREMTSTRQVLLEAGIVIQTNTKSNDLPTRISETKLLFQRGVDVNDTPANKIWYEAIKNYRYPQRKEGSQATSANITPIHDWTSHHATETQFFAVNNAEVPTATSGFVNRLKG